MHTPRDPAVDLLPRSIQRTTPLRRDVGIIHPASPTGRDLAERIAAALRARGATGVECTADVTLMPERSVPLPAAWRRRTLILIGSLNTNRALQPLYAEFLCS
ncbi:MAG TPA: hypothetical protein PLF88_12485, partial [Opitutaceae bacterium]|nr:hypothetical protein [Opitutaceae bacterium]